jgi:tetratricopeptide (TPR) repeat protein
LEFIESLSKEKVAEKDELIATVNSNIGNCYLEMNKYDQAIKAHQKDLEISTAM